jgi:hypothetical protein
VVFHTPHCKANVRSCERRPPRPFALSSQLR